LPPMQTERHTPQRVLPELPQEMPSLMQWNLPAGTSSWSPRLQAPRPDISASTLWNGNTVLQGVAPDSPRLSSHALFDAWQTARLTDRWPLPGTDPQWTPGTWPSDAYGISAPFRVAPFLIPNPVNPEIAEFFWDISQNPVRARCKTGAQANISLTSLFRQQATVPAIEEITISVQSRFFQRTWDSIVVKSRSELTIWDILFGIYEFFQTQLTPGEVEHIQGIDPRNYDILSEACNVRRNTTPAPPGFEHSLDLKRIDLLGDARGFWGLWVSFDEHSILWHLNLGLVNLRPGDLGW